MTRSEKFWDGQAETFDTGEDRFEQLHDKAVENAKKHLHESDTVLDYGCATGTKAFAIAGHVKTIHGIDLSSKMIEVATRRADEHNIENVDFAQATILDERLKPESFDAILAFNILHLVEDNQQAVHRIEELLKPGGVFISVTPCLNEKMAFLIQLQFSFALLLSKLGVIPQYIKRFKIAELEDLIAHGTLVIVETDQLFDGLTSYFVVARKL